MHYLWVRSSQSGDRNGRRMCRTFDLFRMFVASSVGLLGHQQRDVIDYVREENRVPQEHRGDKRHRLNDDQRRGDKCPVLQAFEPVMRGAAGSGAKMLSTSLGLEANWCVSDNLWIMEPLCRKLQLG